MKQRVVVAMALANDPDLLIADEPTTALDVTIHSDYCESLPPWRLVSMIRTSEPSVFDALRGTIRSNHYQAQLLETIGDLQSDREMAVLFVTHDLGVVAGIADHVVVMYGGKVMERGTVTDVFDNPAHPYTRALLACLPGRGVEPKPIGGEPPDPADPPDGCRFHPRCPDAVAACETGTQPPLHDVTVGGEAACVFYDGDRDASLLSDPTRGSDERAVERADGRTAGEGGDDA